MKKTYINPTTTVVEVKVENMIATSLGLVDTAASNEYEMEVKSNSYNGRAGSVDWDDDWSE